jgi:hypothetical protein
VHAVLFRLKRAEVSGSMDGAAKMDWANAANPVETRREEVYIAKDDSEDDMNRSSDVVLGLGRWKRCRDQ